MLKSFAHKEIVKKVCGKIPPLWPLENYVAVNPFLGFSNKSFEETASIMEATAGANLTLPLSFYLSEFEKGNISNKALKKAIANSTPYIGLELDKFITRAKEIAAEEPNNNDKVLLLMDIASTVSDENWGAFVIDRITSWASAYFDKGQALWKTSSKETNIFKAWKEEALIDKTPSIAGLNNFRNTIKSIPNDEHDAISYCSNKLGLDQNGMEVYFFSLLLKVGGWASYCAGLDWDNNIYGGETNYTRSFLAILLSWELAIHESIEATHNYWNNFKRELGDFENYTAPAERLHYKLIFQNAFDTECKNELVDKINKADTTIKSDKKALAQAVFCIDVRSEVFRRNLEMVSDDFKTKGFAGFFGFPVNYHHTGHNNGENQCPVLIPSGPLVIESFKTRKDKKEVAKNRKVNQQYTKAWKAFKSGAVTGFSFVSALGLTYIPKLISDSFGLTRPVENPNEIGMNKKQLADRTVKLGMTIDEQVEMAKNALSAMSFKSNFSKFVLIVGHGSNTVNNPHATGLDCGACGGRTGEANAKVAAAILNNQEVRIKLEESGICIPNETHFLACLHDTTTDNITIYNEDFVPESHKSDFLKIKESLQKAGQAARTERSARFTIEGKNKSKAVLERSKDWSQVRPEWGLAGCNAFVVAPRNRTQNVNLDGKSFLHDYNWKQDEGFKVLTAIMTAPMVVTSWINLQYYASTVDNRVFGAGNKTLHNVVGGFGVIEGQGGDLRVGLPMQSVFDGEDFQHLPQRLNVVIEAPLEAINDVLGTNPNVNDLCSNGWIKLMAMDSSGKVSSEYVGNLKWQTINQTELLHQ